MTPFVVYYAHVCDSHMYILALSAELSLGFCVRASDAVFSLSFFGQISAGLAITVQYMMRCLFLLLSILVQVHLSVSSIGQTIIYLCSYNDQFLLQNRSLLYYKSFSRMVGYTYKV